MKYFLSLLVVLTIAACGPPRVKVTQETDGEKSCYQIEDEMKEIESLIKETDFRSDAAKRAAELDRLYLLKNCS